MDAFAEIECVLSVINIHPKVVLRVGFLNHTKTSDYIEDYKAKFDLVVLAGGDMSVVLDILDAIAGKTTKYCTKPALSPTHSTSSSAARTDAPVAAVSEVSSPSVSPATGHSTAGPDVARRASATRAAHPRAVSSTGIRPGPGKVPSSGGVRQASTMASLKAQAGNKRALEAKNKKDARPHGRRSEL